MQEFLNTKNREGTEKLAPKHIYIPNPRPQQVNEWTGEGLCFQKQQLGEMCLSGVNP